MAEPTVHPTTLAHVAVAAVLGAGAAWIGVQLVSYSGGSLPQPGPGGWVPPLLLGAVTGWLAWSTRRTLHVHHRPLEASVAVTRLRLAKAGVLVAAALGAAYLVLLISSLAGWPAPLAQSRVLHAALSCVTCLVWAVTAAALERACRIPIDPEDAPPEAA